MQPRGGKRKRIAMKRKEEREGCINLHAVKTPAQWMPAATERERFYLKENDREKEKETEGN